MEKNTLDKLELKIPPPLITLLTGLGMWFVARHIPSLSIEIPGREGISLAFYIVGGISDLSGFLAFHKERTTINSLKPASASAMVIQGIYRYTRNPMYLGLLLILTGWAVSLAHLCAFLFLPLFLGYITRFQILPEERILAARFGAEYSAYRDSVRRWI